MSDLEKSSGSVSDSESSSSSGEPAYHIYGFLSVSPVVGGHSDIDAWFSGQRIGAGVVNSSGESDGGLSVTHGPGYFGYPSHHINGDYVDEKEFEFLYEDMSAWAAAMIADPGYGYAFRHGEVVVENTGTAVIWVDVVSTSGTVTPGIYPIDPGDLLVIAYLDSEVSVGDFSAYNVNFSVYP